MEDPREPQHEQERGPLTENTLVLLTGATGYVGGHLLRSLESKGHRVRCLARHPEALEQKAGPSTEVVPGDVLDRPSLDSALNGVKAAYYLVHSMGSSGSFEETDRQAALNFGQSAKAAGVSASFIWEVWAATSKSSRRTCAAGRKSERSCASRASRCSNFARRSSSAPAASRSR